MSRGVRQGCPLSALLFIIVVEILGIQIRNNQDIKGFTFAGNEHKISQYADDCIAMVSDIKCIEILLNSVKSFSNVAGPKLNEEKLEGIWMGPLKGRLPNDFCGIKWTAGAVRCLGVFIGHDKNECDVKNWQNKLTKVEKLLQQWKRRNLTIFGKVIVVRTFVLPMITYCAQLIPTPAEFVSDLNKLLKSFMCIRKYRLGLSTIVGMTENGGINYPDILCTIRALKASWVSRLLDNDSYCHSRNIVNYWCKKIGLDFKTIIKCNFKTPKELPVIRKLPMFYQEVLLAYNLCKTVRPVMDITPYEVVTDIIWGNERFKHDGKCLWFKSWIDSGIIYVRDILDNEGKILDGTRIMNKLQNTCNWIAEYSMVKKACKIVERLSSKLAYTNVKISERPPTIYVKSKNYDIVDKKSGFYYDILRNQIFKLPYMQKVWSKELNLECLEFQDTWHRIYNIKVRKMPVKKLAEFNYKILSGILPCGFTLSKWKKDIPSNCIVCHVKEDLKHMLYDCKKVCDIWKKIGQKLCVLVKWRHIVIGYFQNQNETTKDLNCLFSMVAYSIFKSNNICKWENIEYIHYDVKQRVINDMRLFMSMQDYFIEKYMSQKMLQDIIETLID